jgi:hypothetical protein
VTLTTRARSAADALLARDALVGADPRDDADTRARKTLLVLISILILPISIVWCVLYVAFGAPSGWLAFGYFVISVGALTCSPARETSRCSSASSFSPSCSPRTCR